MAVPPKLMSRERAPREAADPFRPTKAALNRGAHNSMKGRARAVREQSGIILLEGTNKLLTSTHDSVPAPFVCSAPRREQAYTPLAPGGMETLSFSVPLRSRGSRCV